MSLWRFLTVSSGLSEVPPVNQCLNHASTSWPCMLCFRISDLNNILEIRELRFLKSKLWFNLLKISPFWSSVCPSICPSVPFLCIYSWYKVHIFTSIIFYPALPWALFCPFWPLFPLKELSSWPVEHCHGDHMTSLHWEGLPRKPYDVIALEAVAMVTELAEVTGKKGLSSDGRQEMFPSTAVKRRLLFIFLDPREGCLWLKDPIALCPVTSLAGLFPLVLGPCPPVNIKPQENGEKLSCPVVLHKMGLQFLLLFVFSSLVPLVSEINSPAQCLSSRHQRCCHSECHSLSLLHLHQAPCVPVICFPLLSYLSQFLFHHCWHVPVLF